MGKVLEEVSVVYMLFDFVKVAVWLQFSLYNLLASCRVLEYLNRDCGILGIIVEDNLPNFDPGNQY